VNVCARVCKSIEKKKERHFSKLVKSTNEINMPLNKVSRKIGDMD